MNAAAPQTPDGTDPITAWKRTVLHVDMDAFYAAVEVLLDPALAGRPVIVGGTGPRGVVASCSYEARAFGVRSAMPSVRARRLCPSAVFLPGHHGVYADYSRRIHEVFGRFTPIIEPIALDEAFLDVSPARRLFGDGPRVAALVRTAVRADTGLCCSVGVGTSKLIAKLASKAAKPPITAGALGSAARPAAKPETSEGIFVVEPGTELAFLHPQPVRALWGVGPATFGRLARYGVQTVGDLARLPEEVVIRALGTANGRHLHALAWGRDDRAVEPDRPLKSVGHEETFAEDRFTLAGLATEALRMADSVARRMRDASVRGRTVQLKVRFADFRTITRSRTVDRFIDTAAVIHTTALAMLGEAELRADVERVGVRLLGVSVANLEGRHERSAAVGTTQLDLFGTSAADVELDVGQAARTERHRTAGNSSYERPHDEVARRVAEAMDAIRGRFGDAAVGPAALVGPRGLRVKVGGDTQWGPNEAVLRPDGHDDVGSGPLITPPRSAT